MRGIGGRSPVTAAIAILAIVAAWLLFQRQRPAKVSLPDTQNVAAAQAPRQAKRSPRYTPALTDSEMDSSANGASSSTKSFTERLSEGFIFSPEQLAEYLRQNGTNVESLLVASQLGTNRNEFLKLAATLFPDDPRVQFAVVAHDVFPGAKREWLNRFKESAPDNALASFLSAREYAKSGDRAAAIRELLDAAGKPHFNDYTLDRWQTTEEAQLQAGRPIAEAKASSASGLLLPHLSQLKAVSQEMQKWQKEYAAAGDTASAQNLAQIGSTLSRHLIDGEGSHFLINQLVGVAVERMLLSQLPPDSHPEFLQGTVQERLDELSKFRETTKSLVHTSSDFMDRGDEAALISFYDRMKVHGEYNTLKWLQQKQQSQPSSASSQTR